MSSVNKPYTLFKRGKCYYARFRLPDGTRSIPKSTGETARVRAETWAINYLQTGNGQIVVKEGVTLQEFSKNFFNWNGPWATDKKVRGLRISEQHCLQRSDILKNHLLPALGNMRLTGIDRGIIKTFRNNLFNQGYSGNTINKCLSALKAILETAEEQSLIQYVPRIDRAADNPKTKGILTPEEVKKLFSFEWTSRAIFRHPPKSEFIGQIGNLIAVTTGLRISEIQALTLRDVNLDNNYLIIRRSWSNHLNRLNQTTKTGKERRVFFSEIIRTNIIKLIEINPYKHNPDAFLFFSRSGDRPTETLTFTRSFFYALEQIGITQEEREARNITFHSHRHFLNSLLINAKIPLQKVQSIIGHTTLAMTQNYYRIDDMHDILDVTDAVLKLPERIDR